MMLLFVICGLFLAIQPCASSNEYSGSGVNCQADGNQQQIISTNDPVEPILHGLQTVAEDNNDNIWSRCCGDFGGLVKCVYRCGGPILEVAHCYCLTSYVNDPNTTIIGLCLYTCYPGNLIFNMNRTNAPALTEQQCNSIHRTGQLCGQCKTEFSPPVYSYNFECVQCPLHDNHFKRWAKYIVIAFVPLTIFFLIVTTLHISATSPSMNAFILFSQLLTSPLIARILIPHIQYLSHYYSICRIIDQMILVTISLYGIWNLDFFHSYYSPFCIHPNMTTLQVLALDYIIAVYPLFLIVVTYALVELHDQNFTLVVWLWKPFRRCFISFRRYWNVKTSLIDAFATFLLLSYVKFLSVSFDLLTPVQLTTANGYTIKNETYLYYDATIPYFSKQHLPYAILAITVLILFNFLPIVLLCLYPCQCFQKLLNCCRLRCTVLHTFMDIFQGCYRNRTDSTYDHRWFSAVYLIIRIACFGIVAVTQLGILFLTYIGTVLVICAILIGVIQPYKSHIYNSIDTALILTFVACTLLITILYVEHLRFKNYHVSSTIAFICALVPLVYILAISIHWLLIQKKVPQRICHMMLKLLLPCKRLVRQRNTEELLPDRLVNPEECAALLRDPMAVDQGSNVASGGLDSY